MDHFFLMEFSCLCNHGIHGMEFWFQHSWWNFPHWISLLMKTDGMLESAMECVNTERQRAREKWVGRVKPHGIFIPAEEWWNGGIFPRMCQHRNRDGEREIEGGDISCGICLLMNDGMVESICLLQNVSAQRETEEAAGDRQANVFLHDWIFLGFWQRMLDLELGLQSNWEGVLNWVSVSFFEASTKTSVGSSDSQRISCVSKSAAGIVVDGAHTNSRHWNCGPWCPPLGSRPLCKHPLHLFPSSLLPPLEKNKFCKLLSSSCKNAHKDQVILEFWILECHKDLLVILEFFKVYLCNVVKMRWFWSSFFVSIFRWCWTMESCKWLSLSLKGSSLAWAMEVSRMCSRLVTRKQIEGNFETLILLLLFFTFFSPDLLQPSKITWLFSLLSCRSWNSFSVMCFVSLRFAHYFFFLSVNSKLWRCLDCRYWDLNWNKPNEKDTFDV